MSQFESELWYHSADDAESVAHVSLDGPNPTGQNINPEHDLTYHVVSGEAIFCVNGVKHLIQAGEDLKIARLTPYSNFGKNAAMIVKSNPAWNV